MKMARQAPELGGNSHERDSSNGDVLFHIGAPCGPAWKVHR